jgi:hypothetical protein
MATLCLGFFPKLANFRPIWSHLVFFLNKVQHSVVEHWLAESAFSKLGAITTGIISYTETRAVICSVLKHSLKIVKKF